VSKFSHPEFKHDIITYMVEVARGNVPGASLLNAYGELTTGGAVSNALIWPIPGTTDVPVPAAAGVQMSVSSSSANDTAAGTGIRTLDIHYLDGNLDEQVELVTMNGTTPVLTVATDIRFVQCIHMVTFGSGRAAEGNISVTNGGVTYSYIQAGRRRCSSSARMIPRGKVGFVHAIWGGSASGTAATSSTIRMSSTAITGQSFSDTGLLFPHASISVQDSSQAVTLFEVFPVPAGDILAMQVSADKGATISGGWAGWIENA